MFNLWHIIKGVRRALRSDIQATIRDLPPFGDGETAQRIAPSLAPALHRLDLVGRVRVRAPKRGRDVVVVASLPQEPAARSERARGHDQDARAFQRPHAPGVLPGPVPARQPATHSFLN